VPVRRDFERRNNCSPAATKIPTTGPYVALTRAEIARRSVGRSSTEQTRSQDMHRLIIGTITAAVMALGVSGVGFAAPSITPYENDNPTASHVQQVDYYWDHHYYHHRDWDRHQHRWHYYD
jgi:hypothetical protein